jgi:hypothetical protein
MHRLPVLFAACTLAGCLAAQAAERPFAIRLEIRAPVRVQVGPEALPAGTGFGGAAPPWPLHLPGALPLAVTYAAPAGGTVELRTEPAAAGSAADTPRLTLLVQ